MERPPLKYRLTRAAGFFDSASVLSPNVGEKQHVHCTGGANEAPVADWLESRASLPFLCRGMLTELFTGGIGGL